MIDLDIPAHLGGQRLDAALARLLPQHSRTRIKGWIESGAVTVGNLTCKPRDLVSGGDRIRLCIPSEPAVSSTPQAEHFALQTVYEDRDVLVIDKPAGLVVHPGAGNPRHTLQNGLLGFDPDAAALPRAGIIHRLDKDTSGLLVVARTLEAHTALTRQLAARTIDREYLAVCIGVMTGGGTIDQPIGRNRTDRLRMTVRADGRPARTHYRVLERFRGHTYLRVKLETGRTHQIRLHLAHIRFPIAGDPVYGPRHMRPAGVSDELAARLRGFKRQALHAATLAFDHPRTGQRLALASPVPQDLAELLTALRADAKDHALRLTAKDAPWR